MTCHAMEGNTVPLSALGKHPIGFEDKQLRKFQKTTEEQQFNSQELPTPNEQNQIYPPLELWEKVLTGLGPGTIENLEWHIQACHISFPPSRIPSTFNAFSNIELPSRDLSILMRFYVFMLGFMQHITTSKNNTIDNQSTAAKKWLYLDNISQLDKINPNYIKDNNFFQEWKKIIAIDLPAPLSCVPKELQQILGDKGHPQYSHAVLLIYSAHFLNLYFCLRKDICEKIIDHHEKQIQHINNMLSAGYIFSAGKWKFCHSDMYIPPMNYYFLNHYADDCPEKWMDIYEESCPLSFESPFQTEKLRQLLNNYHGIDKKEAMIPNLINALKKIIGHINSFEYCDYYDTEEEIKHLKVKADEWVSYCKKLDNIDAYIDPEQLKQQIISLFNNKLTYVLGKLNINLGDNNNDMDNIFMEVSYFSNEKYNTIINKIAAKEDELEEKKEGDVLQDLQVRAEKRLNFYKGLYILREKAEKYIENSRSQLLPLLPIIRSALAYIDPLRRTYLESYLLEWQELSKTGANIPDFFFWLDSANIPAPPATKSKLSPDNAKVKFNQGVAYNAFWAANNDTLPLEGAYIYIICPARLLYVAPESRLKEMSSFFNSRYSERYQHEQISKEPWAICAGQMIFKKGKIVYINRQSGHYQPDIKHLKYGIKSLQQMYGKKIFCKDFIIDNSLTTKIEFEPCENLIILSRALEGEVILTRLEKELTLFDLGFKN